MARLFVAIDLPPSLRRELAALLPDLAGMRRVAEEQLHLTLRFIGEVDEKQAETVKLGLATDPELAGGAFTLALAGVGAFPARGPARVLWVGVAPNPALLALAARVEACLAGLGVEPEPRPFSPHITLARLHQAPAARVREFLAAQAQFRSAPFLVEEFRLYSSLLSAKGALHRVEECYRLGQALTNK